MVGNGSSKKIPAASARSHTRTSTPSSFSGLFSKLLLVALVCLLAWTYQAARPPPSKICGSPNAPPVTAPRIMLSDGRHLAYKEHGVPKDTAKFKFVFIHGFTDNRHDAIQISQDLYQSLGIYLVSFDRPGYGESDPHPNQKMKSIALDVEELADQLGLGKNFYVIGYSLGGMCLWSCLKYIPHRLAGATLIAPGINYWWPSLPSNMSSEAFSKLLQRDIWSLRVAHYLPGLTYWWNTQKFFPPFSVISGNLDVMSRQDKEILGKYDEREHEASIRQQGEFESVHRDLMVAWGKWEFDPTELTNPFPNNEGSFHLWQGDEDLIVPVTLQRYIAEKLPWIHYHEVPGAGHVLSYAKGMSDTIIKTQLSL